MYKKVSADTVKKVEKTGISLNDSIQKRYLHHIKEDQ